MTLAEIEARMSEIATECENATGEALTALETELRTLTEQRENLINEAQRKQAMRAQVAAGAATVIPTARTADPAAVTPTAEEVEAAEVRSFAEYIRGNVTEMRSGEQNFNIGNNGAVIPTSIARKIIEKVIDMCPILRGADVYHVNGTLKIPAYGPKTVSGTDHDITVAYGEDFAELTADAGAFTSVDLGGYLVGALTLVGRSLITNADIDLVSFVVTKMAESISVFVEGELLNGSGSSNKHCTGALSTTNSIKAGSTTAITADNLIDLQACVKQAFQSGACWTMNPATWTLIKKLKDKNDRYLVQDDFTGEFPYRLLGRPVYLSDAMPTIASGAKAVLYGDYSGLAVNIRENVSVEVLREKYATQHAIGVVGWMELDSNVEDSQKLATLEMSTAG